MADDFDPNFNWRNKNSVGKSGRGRLYEGAISMGFGMILLHW